MVVSSMVTSISSMSETSPISLSIYIVSAPSISQATMDKMLSGLDHVFCCLDDVLIATNNHDHHLEVL